MTAKKPELSGQPPRIRGSFAKRLKELREGKGIPQSEMAKICGIAVASYANWEQGRALPPITQIPTLAEFFGVSADYLLGISKQEATERLVERMANLPEKSQKIVMALIDEIIAMK